MLYFSKKIFFLYFRRVLAKPEKQKFLIFRKNTWKVSTAARENSYETSIAARENPYEANTASELSRKLRGSCMLRIKVAATHMRYFAESKFSESLVRKKNFSLL